MSKNKNIKMNQLQKIVVCGTTGIINYECQIVDENYKNLIAWDILGYQKRNEFKFDQYWNNLMCDGTIWLKNYYDKLHSLDSIHDKEKIKDLDREMCESATHILQAGILMKLGSKKMHSLSWYLIPIKDFEKDDIDHILEKTASSAWCSYMKYSTEPKDLLFDHYY